MSSAHRTGNTTLERVDDRLGHGGLEAFGHPFTPPFAHRGATVQLCQLGALHADPAGHARLMNSSTPCVVVMSETYARAHGHTPLARILATAVGAGTPETEGPVTVAATRTALTRAGLSLADVGTFAGNEPFAAQILAYRTELGLEPERTNPHGGSIALGEPYRAAGARLTTTALATLRHDDLSTALISLVAAGGQGMALLLERAS